MHASLLKADAGKGDFYPTPAWATEAILDREPLPGTIWEPACGDGSMARVIMARPDRVVHATDLYDRGFGQAGRDFLKEPDYTWYGSIITNPPYSLAQEFVEKACRLATGKVLMLLKLNFLEGVARHEMFRRLPPVRIWVFSRRIKFPMPSGTGGGVLAYAWFVWERGYTGAPQLRWIL